MRPSQSLRPPDDGAEPVALHAHAMDIGVLHIVFGTLIARRNGG